MPAGRQEFIENCPFDKLRILSVSKEKFQIENYINMSDEILRISRLNKIFPNNLQALSEIAFSVKKQEFVSIIGPSGCGKSTLFNILAGVENQTTGAVELNGKTVAKRAGLFGYMPQSPLLLPWRTVLENVILGQDVLRVPRKISKQKAMKILQQFGLSEFAANYPNTLSGGMKQRIALIRTVLFQKDFLLLDEPFGALDSLTRLSCQLWLLELQKKLKPTILFITHDVREAIFLSDTIYVLSPRPGKIIKKFEVGLPRPRQKEQLASQLAVRLEQKILSHLFNEKSL